MSKEVIMKVPSFSADYPKAPIYVADLVRCKECKWAKANGTYQWCGRLDSTARITADDFCSYGQKGDENVETD